MKKVIYLSAVVAMLSFVCHNTVVAASKSAETLPTTEKSVSVDETKKEISTTEETESSIKPAQASAIELPSVDSFNTLFNNCLNGPENARYRWLVDISGETPEAVVRALSEFLRNHSTPESVKKLADAFPKTNAGDYYNKFVRAGADWETEALDSIKRIPSLINNDGILVRPYFMHNLLIQLVRFASDKGYVLSDTLVAALYNELIDTFKNGFDIASRVVTH